jgi:hypothetical protein
VGFVHAPPGETPHGVPRGRLYIGGAALGAMGFFFAEGTDLAFRTAREKMCSRVGQGALRPPSPSKNRTCEFPRIRLKPFIRPISRPGC